MWEAQREVQLSSLSLRSCTNALLSTLNTGQAEKHQPLFISTHTKAFTRDWKRVFFLLPVGYSSIPKDSWPPVLAL